MPEGLYPQYDVSLSTVFNEIIWVIETMHRAVRTPVSVRSRAINVHVSQSKLVASQSGYTDIRLFSKISENLHN